MSESDFRDEGARDEAEQASSADETVTGRDAGPVDEDAMAAAEGLEVRPGVAEHYQEMTGRGAGQQGEGRLP